MDATAAALATLFADHLRTVADDTAAALDHARAEGVNAEGVVFHAGTRRYYHQDDRAIPFRPTAPFLRFAPLVGPDHVVLFRSGEIECFEVATVDFWEEAPPADDHPFRSAMRVHTVRNQEELRSALGDVSRFAYVGDDPAFATRLGIAPAAVEAEPLVRALDWFRAYKTPYEVDRTRAAARRAGRGYRALLEGFDVPESERSLSDRFFAATDHRETDVAFDPIVAWDEHASVLHYQTKRATPPTAGRVLLIDAGASVDGYNSDTTRTYLRGEIDPRFRTLHEGVDTLVTELIDDSRPGVGFLELHERANQRVAELLRQVGVFHCSADEAVAEKLTAAFFPHGLGHHLGLNVHDRGGHLAGPTGPVVPPPDHFPFLRTTRPLEVNHVVTIEPGIYFIPMLLDPHRAGPHASKFDWPTVDALLPYGGIRIEDDILITENQPENLTQQEIPR